MQSHVLSRRDAGNTGQTAPHIVRAERERGTENANEGIFLFLCVCVGGGGGGG